MTADLVPKEVVEAWLKYLREELPTVAFKCSTQKQASNLGRKASTTQGAVQGSECLGADILLQLLKNYARGKNGLKTSVTVGIVGLPNVGKSSLINSLKRTRVARVGNAPGITKSVQEINLDKQVTLLDSPGVVFSEVGEDGKAAAALRNCVKVEQLEDPSLPVSEILKRCPKMQLMKLYRIPDYSNIDSFLVNIATVRGKLKKGGTVDSVAAAKIVLQDWNDGRIPYYTTPPKRQSEVAGSSTVVQSWAVDFDINALNDQQTKMMEVLPNLEGGKDQKSFFETDTTGEVHMAVNDSGNVDMMDEDDAPALKTKKARNQNDRLYDNEGQYNPHKSKKMRAKRKIEQNDAAMEDNSDSDFDFSALPEETGNMFDKLNEESDDVDDLSED